MLLVEWKCQFDLLCYWHHFIGAVHFAECIGTLLVWRDVIALKAPLMQWIYVIYARNIQPLANMQIFAQVDGYVFMSWFLRFLRSLNIFSGNFMELCQNCWPRLCKDYTVLKQVFCCDVTRNYIHCQWLSCHSHYSVPLLSTQKRYTVWL